MTTPTTDLSAKQHHSTMTSDDRQMLISLHQAKREESQSQLLRKPRFSRPSLVGEQNACAHGVHKRRMIETLVRRQSRVPDAVFLSDAKERIGFCAGTTSDRFTEEPKLGFEIQAASEADLASILALYAEVEDDARVISIEEARLVFARMGNYPDYRVYVAKSGKSIVGTFALLIMDNLAHMGAPSGVVEDLVVHRDWRGKGVGKQMMQFAMNRCRERGCYKLALSSNLKREAAHRFYDDLGFQRHGYSFIVELNQS